MSESTAATTPREEPLIMVRERFTSRLAAVEKEIEIHQTKLEELMLERIELQAELKVLDKQTSCE